GVVDWGSLLDVPPEGFRRDIETNYYGPLNVTRAFAPKIEANGGGAVANVLSLASFVSMPRIAAYNASKAAAWSMTQALRADLASRGNQVFGIFPGPVDTDMARSIDLPKASPTDVANEILEGIENGTEDIFPDSMAKEFYEAWKSDHKAVERQYALAMSSVAQD